MENPKTDTLYRVWELTTSWINASLKMPSEDDLNESILPGKNLAIWSFPQMYHNGQLAILLSKVCKMNY